MMGILLLLLTTCIWGSAFLAQKLIADSIGPFAVTVFRSILGVGFLIACISVRGGIRRLRDVRSVVAGVCCGVPLFAAMMAQQIGIKHTMPGVSAFLTANYVLFVPVMAAAITRRMPRWFVWLGVTMTLVGTYFISVPADGFSIGRGESWTILCALLFSVQMIAVDRFARQSDLLVMSVVQLLTCGVLGLPFLLLPSEAACIGFKSLGAAVIPLVYLGVFSSGIAYTLQNVGQSKTSPGIAAIILSLESVVGALSGWIFLGDLLSTRQIFGCSCVFLAVMIVSVLNQLHVKGKSHAFIM